MPRRPDAAPGTDTPPVALHKLPPQLKVLVRCMGEAAAFRLVKARGGTPLHVPKTVHSPRFAGLVELCGDVVAAAALVAELGPATIQLPKYDAVARQLRHAGVIERRQRGDRLASIALATGYTMRQVINILNAAGLQEVGEGPANDQVWHQQLGLFEPAE